MNNSKNNKYNRFKLKLKTFFKKNGYAFTVSVCVLVIFSALVISAVVQSKNNNLIDLPPEPETENVGNNEQEEIQPVINPDPIAFVMPVENYTLGTTFSKDKLVKNETLGEWSTHEGLDFIAPAGTAVVASVGGTVEAIEYTALEGTVVTIVMDNIKTIYKSLSNQVEVMVGQTVEAGQQIGYVSASAGNELKMGDHLHFELWIDGASVDPSEYLFAK